MTQGIDAVKARNGRKAPTPVPTVTVVVAADGSGDVRTIQEAIGLLPATGGTIFVREGTYNITAPIDLPERPIKIIGAGCGCIPGYNGWPPGGFPTGTSFAPSTIISLGSNAIPAFRLPASMTKGCLAYIEDIKIAGDGTVGQCVLQNDSPSAFPGRVLQLFFSRVFSENIEKYEVITALASITMLTLVDCYHWFSTGGTPLTVDNANAGSYPTLTLLRSFLCYDTALAIKGGFTNGANLSVWADRSSLGIGVSSTIGALEMLNSTVPLLSGGTTLTLGSYSKLVNSKIYAATENCFLAFAANAEKCHFTATEFRMGTVALVATNRRNHFIGCRFGKVTIAGYENVFIGNEFLQAVGYALDIANGAYENVIDGNYFKGQTTAAIRNDGQKNVVSNNSFATTLPNAVIETANADANRYTGNAGFGASTILGVDYTFVDGVSVRSKATSPVALNETYETLKVNTGIGNITVNLPAAATYKNKTFTITKSTVDANTVIIMPNGAETISGNPSVTLLLQYEVVKVVSDGVNWLILSQA
jgi:hypothetical protein